MKINLLILGIGVACFFNIQTSLANKKQSGFSSGLCITKSVDSLNINDYLISLVNTLEQLSEARELLLLLNEKMTSVEILTQIKKNIEKNTCALEILKPFTDSKNERVASSAKGISQSISIIRAGAVGTANEFKQRLNGQGEEEPAGDAADRKSNEAIIISDAWRTLALSYSLATHSFIDYEKKTPTLKIDTKVRKHAIHELESAFGKTLNKSHAIEVSAQGLLIVLKDKWNTK